MSSGKRLIGTAKGKQPNTEALCQSPRPPCRVCAAGQELQFHLPKNHSITLLSADLKYDHHRIRHPGD